MRQETGASTWRVPVGPTRDTVPRFRPAGLRCRPQPPARPARLRSRAAVPGRCPTDPPDPPPLRNTATDAAAVSYRPAATVPANGIYIPARAAVRSTTSVSQQQIPSPRFSHRLGSCPNSGSITRAEASSWHAWRDTETTASTSPSSRWARPVSARARPGERRRMASRPRRLQRM